MGNIATVEGMTAGQAGRISDHFSPYCRKEGTVLPKDTVQAVLDEEMEDLLGEMFEALRTRVERRAKIITRRVKVNRDQTPEQIVNATGRKQYVNAEVLSTMPRQGAGIEEVDVYFFNVGKYLSIAEQEKVLAERGLVPDYYAQVQVNIDDPLFADEHPNGAQWDNKDGKAASFVTFSRWDDGRGVDVIRGGGGWNDDWWLAGVRKT